MSVLGWQEKHALLREYWDRYGPFRFVVETGVWNGKGSCFQFQGEAEVVAVEKNDESAALARAKGFDVRTGDSGLLLPGLLAARDAPALFWLDAHDSVEGGDAESSTPILAELGAIASWPHAAGSVVLIDDARCFAWPEWPNWNDVVMIAGGVWLHHEVRDDVVRLSNR